MTLAGSKRDRSDDRLRPCVFLDRDGVLNHDVGYTYRPEDLRWIDGAREAVKLLNDAGYLVVVATNQSGVARGRYTEADVDAFHAHMSAQLAEAGGRIDAFYHCPYHHEGVVERYCIADHPDRKPNPGMILRAMADLPIRREGSFLIGDRDSDIEAAAAAGLPGVRFEGGDLHRLLSRLIADQSLADDA